METFQIPFNKPHITGNEFQYIQAALQSGHISGDGSYSKKSQNLLKEVLSTQKVLLTTSCTDALEMAALLVDIQSGDEVIIPSFTFVSTVNAFVLRGAHPVFIDIRPDTLNLDETHLEKHITSRTKAIVPVHYAGVGCEMDSILATAAQHGIAVVEDNAHGLFAKYKGKHLGTFGGLATQSFHETKNLTCGEGGALLINELKYLERAEILREKGTNRSRFFRGQVDKYTWVDIGSSFLPSEILAAFLFAQLENWKEIQTKRQKIWEHYDQNLREWASVHDIQPPYVPEHCDQSFHMYYMLFPSLQKRQALIEHLKTKGILSVFHYLPLHLSDMGLRFGGKVGDCPVTENVSDRLLRLPFYADLSEQEQDCVIAAVKEYYE